MTTLERPTNYALTLLARTIGFVLQSVLTVITGAVVCGSLVALAENTPIGDQLKAFQPLAFRIHSADERLEIDPEKALLKAKFVQFVPFTDETDEEIVAEATAADALESVIIRIPAEENPEIGYIYPQGYIVWSEFQPMDS